MGDYHTSVLLREAVDGLDVQSGKRYVDATVGGGGHTAEILARGGIVLGIDTDEDSIRHVRQRVVSNQLTLVQGNFRDIELIAKENGFDQVNGVFFDLGVSSHQLNERTRGFSHRFDDAPLDMRLGNQIGQKAEDIVRQASLDELYDIFATYGEEQLASPIARAIVHARAVMPITTSGQLAAIVQGAVRDQRHSTAILSRIYQAIRIAVNDEMGALRQGLFGAMHMLSPGGRMAIISFHSLEDRMVKQFFRSSFWKTINKRPITPRELELYDNPRARSAKLRIGEKII